MTNEASVNIHIEGLNNERLDVDIEVPCVTYIGGLYMDIKDVEVNYRGSYFELNIVDGSAHAVIFFDHLYVDGVRAL